MNIKADNNKVLLGEMDANPTPIVIKHEEYHHNDHNNSGGGNVFPDTEDTDENEMVCIAQYLNSNCVVYKYFQDDVSKVVQHHFDRALSSVGTSLSTRSFSHSSSDSVNVSSSSAVGKKVFDESKDVTPSISIPMSQRKFPPSFWEFSSTNSRGRQFSLPQTCQSGDEKTSNNAEESKTRSSVMSTHNPMLAPAPTTATVATSSVTNISPGSHSSVENEINVTSPATTTTVNGAAFCPSSNPPSVSTRQQQHSTPAATTVSAPVGDADVRWWGAQPLPFSDAYSFSSSSSRTQHSSFDSSFNSHDAGYHNPNHHSTRIKTNTQYSLPLHDNVPSYKQEEYTDGSWTESNTANSGPYSSQCLETGRFMLGTSPTVSGTAGSGGGCHSSGGASWQDYMAVATAAASVASRAAVAARGAAAVDMMYAAAYNNGYNATDLGTETSVNSSSSSSVDNRFYDSTVSYNHSPFPTSSASSSEASSSINCGGGGLTYNNTAPASLFSTSHSNKSSTMFNNDSSHDPMAPFHNTLNSDTTNTFSGRGGGINDKNISADEVSNFSSGYQLPSDPSLPERSSGIGGHPHYSMSSNPPMNRSFYYGHANNVFYPNTQLIGGSCPLMSESGGGLSKQNGHVQQDGTYYHNSPSRCSTGKMLPCSNPPQHPSHSMYLNHTNKGRMVSSPTVRNSDSNTNFDLNQSATNSAMSQQVQQSSQVLHNSTAKSYTGYDIY